MLALLLYISGTTAQAHDEHYGHNDRHDDQVFVRQKTPVDFGKFTLSARGSVTVDPRTGSCVARGGAVLVKPVCARGVLELRGDPGEQVAVYFPPEISLSGRGRGELVMREITMDRDNPVVIGPDGKAVIGVGATLTGGGGVTNGQFSGQYQVQIAVLK